MAQTKQEILPSMTDCGSTPGVGCVVEYLDSTRKDNLGSLIDDVKSKISEYLSHDDLIALVITSKANRFSFLKACDITGALQAVVEGNPKQLKRILQRNPDLLFLKSTVVDPAGQKYHDVSPFQLMIFLVDDCMLKDILEMDILRRSSDGFEIQLQVQMRSMACGGADLVKLNFDPLTGSAFSTMERTFEAILHSRERFDVWVDRHVTLEADFPLLENSDGILCYHNLADDTVKWYYANKETQTLLEVKLKDPTTAEEIKEQYQLTRAFKGMDDNTARRSSIEEHEWIKKHLYADMKVQEGIAFTRTDGVRYRDTRFPFNDYFDTAKKCHRLNLEGDFGAAQLVWLELGKKQLGWIWGMQLLCQKNLVFFPLHLDLLTHRKSNDRDLTLYNGLVLFKHGEGFHKDLGTKFTLYKGSNAGCKQSEPCREEMLYDIIAFRCLIEDAKSSIIHLLTEREDCSMRMK